MRKERNSSQLKKACVAAPPHPVFFASFRSRAWRRRLRRLLARTQPIARLNKRDQHQRPAQRRLRIPNASRTTIFGARDTNNTAIPAEYFPCPRNHRHAAYREALPEVGQLQRPRLRSATDRPAALVPHCRAICGSARPSEYNAATSTGELPCTPSLST